MKKHLKIDIQMDEYNVEEEMEIADNVPLLQNAYKIFKNAMNNHWKENSEISATANGVLAPGSAHARPSAHAPIDTSGYFSAHMSAKSPSNISPNPRTTFL